MSYVKEDCTYTLIKIPSQNKTMNGKKGIVRIFMIHINKHMVISLPLYQNLTFLYSGKFITHRQYCDNNCYSNGSLFYNIGSHGNKIIYSHLRQSFLRNKV